MVGVQQKIYAQKYFVDEYIQLCNEPQFAFYLELQAF